MAADTYKTIIIGAGISGIGCAHKLLENKQDFKIISPDVGGRIIESDSKTVEYGAYYVMDIYHNTASFVKIGERIKPTKLIFHKSNHSYTLFDKKLFTHLPQLIRLILILYKFKRHYEKFKKRSVTESQINCLKKDKYLWKLYHSNAHTFVEKSNIKEIVYSYMAEVIHGTTFTPIKDLNAFTFLHFSLPLIVPVYEFIFKKEEVVRYLKSHLIQDEVTKIDFKNQQYCLITKKSKRLFCDNLVVATPPHISKKLLKFKQPLRKPAKANMLHLIGEIKSDWNQSDGNLFDDKNIMLAIAHQRDNSYLFYTKDAKPDLNKYFYNFKIIKHKHWNPAFNIGGDNIIDFIQGKNLFVIGDNNICGLEDSYIYGMYAANKVLGRTID